MIRYVPFRHLNNITPLNRKMLEVINEVNALREEIDELKAHEVFTGETQTENAGFDWEASDDAQALKEFAMEEYGLEIKGNKKADTVRKEIAEFLEDAE